MQKITVNIKTKHLSSYNILIGSNLVESIVDLVDLSCYSSVAVITDTNLKPYLESFLNKSTFNPTVIVLPPGEMQKNIACVKLIWDKLLNSDFDRKSLVINLGGGVITDMGGFAASTFMRGVDFVNIPTTLLSQVDASIGGKTGIDFDGYKNLIGTFNQPKMVIIDVDFLKTLPEREFNAGFAEIIKHALIKDEGHFNYVSSKKPKEFSTNELIDIIVESLEIKKSIIEKDPSEQGLRKVLNFGHTIGHAIESLSLETPKQLLHGEAISLGMTAEAKISQHLGNISEADLKKIVNSLQNADLPVKTNLKKTQIIKKLGRDKKNISGEINWTVLKKLGEAQIDVKVDEQTLNSVLDYIL